MLGIGAIVGGNAVYAAVSGISGAGRVPAVNKPANKPLTAAEYNRRFDRVEISGQNKGGGFVPGMIEVKERAAGRGGNEFDNLPKVKNSSETECQTCKERKYVDGSNDSGVSFQTPTSVDPGSEASAVRSHEQEHVTRNAAKAQREGMTARSSVKLNAAICPECGRLYISGGTTTTTFTRKADKDIAQKFAVGIEEQGKKSQEFAA
ncbi:MAG: hypothetical protein LBM59_01530 [Ruminococcus sp.]|jgi:hypothetical protein|nr:hypothetical protein [Ruminococcus sp.]